MAKRPSGRAREHQALVPGCAKRAGCQRSSGAMTAREVNHATARLRLGRAEREWAGDLVQLPDDPDCADLQVNIATAKRSQLAPAQTAETCQDH